MLILDVTSMQEAEFIRNEIAATLLITEKCNFILKIV
jgi:hypothetical protein